MLSSGLETGIQQMCTKRIIIALITHDLHTCFLRQRRPNQTAQKLRHSGFALNFQRLLLTEFTTKIIFDYFIFRQIVSKIHNKDNKINAFCLPCINCAILFHFDEFWDGFCRAFLIRLVLLHFLYLSTDYTLFLYKNQ